LALLVAVVPSTPVLGAAYLYLYPTSGEIDDDVEVYGYNFNPGASVYIYFSSDEAEVGDDLDDEVNAYERVVTTSASTMTASVGEIDTSFTVPDELTDGDDEERVRGGTYYIYATYSGNKNIEAVAEFDMEDVGVIELDPEEGAVGTAVEITGYGFGDREDLTVEYDGDEVDIENGDDATDRNGEFQCTILIPESAAGEHIITVIGEDSDIEGEAEFNVLPEITLSPQAGAAGDTVNVRGTGFGDRASLNIFFGNFRVVTGRITDRYGSFELTFEVLPSGPGSHYVEVTDGSGNSGKEKFTIGAMAVNLNPITGYAGTEVTVSGVGFAASKMVTIKFADIQARTTATDTGGKFSDKFIVPQYSSGNYNVVVTDGANTVTIAFTIPTSVSLSQTTGDVGIALTVSGNGFSGTVTIRYDDTTVATTPADASGIFVANFKVPPSIHGKHTITASDAMNTIRTEFNIESVPPFTPTPLLPAAGSREKSQGSFQWDAVTDPSGVKYMLQIASDVQFTNILLEKKGLSIPEYTMLKTENLPSTSKEAPYYWRVRAIDGASNESAWSEASSFYISFFPDWAKYILIVLGSLAVALAVFWLGMKMARPAKERGGE
ncbi:IPT/TIG domain-containing protein, partial [Chloroflexota bacterium]